MRMEGQGRIRSNTIRNDPSVGVPSLEQFCVRTLVRNLDYLTEVGDVPLRLLEPVLKHCTGTQLQRLELHNPHFKAHTDDYWKHLCETYFPPEALGNTADIRKDDHSTWRDHFRWCEEEKARKVERAAARVRGAYQTEAQQRKTRQLVVTSLSPQVLKSGLGINKFRVEKSTSKRQMTAMQRIYHQARATSSRIHAARPSRRSDISYASTPPGRHTAPSPPANPHKIHQNRRFPPAEKDRPKSPLGAKHHPKSPASNPAFGFFLQIDPKLAAAHAKNPERLGGPPRNHSAHIPRT
ncbi:hypothetical protein IWQ62_000359 [Dispira parvispora]|uniref:Elongin-A n=1 Tax=Dispira parvispora TaxID=1520584 RepID=A0A9W8AUX2_9FUNG|nr:hypothetical protein IWQ62_000359 [Dispira parvispora]